MASRQLFKQGKVVSQTGRWTESRAGRISSGTPGRIIGKRAPIHRMWKVHRMSFYLMAFAGQLD